MGFQPRRNSAFKLRTAIAALQRVTSSEPFPAMLFCAPLPPQRVPPDAPLTIGRQPDCDFPLRRGDVSRRHAEVRFCDGAYWLHDLGSTNGTFVNGQRLAAPRALAPGDRVEIGSSTLTFCRLDPAADDGAAPPGEAHTVVAGPPSPREAFQGDLAEIPSFALLQMLELGGKTGLLEVAGPDGVGQVWFAGGSPVHAQTAKGEGFEAAIEVVRSTRGSFRFEPGPLEPEVSIRASVTDLLLEASRRDDEDGSA